MNIDLSVSSYGYDLPDSFIAQEALEPRDAAKLLVYKREDQGQGIIHKKVSDLSDILDDNTVLFFNNTKVVKARIPLHAVRCVFSDGREKRVDGEIFFLLALDEYRCEALVRPGKKMPVGSRLFFDDGISFSVESITEAGRILCCSDPINSVLESYGQLPLPPYIRYEQRKEERYQTVFAKHLGSVAAPTASLHFSDSLFDRLATRGVSHDFVTLHVGLGTFKPLEYEVVTDNRLHDERVVIDVDLFRRVADHALEKKKLIPVGTTACRVLESLPYAWLLFSQHDGFASCGFSHEVISFWEQLVVEKKDADFIHDLSLVGTELSFSTCLFVYPGFSLRVVDGLFTNFHLPKSSLMMLVSCVLGSRELLLALYEEAKRSDYRFFSFGDAVLIL